MWSLRTYVMAIKITRHTKYGLGYKFTVCFLTLFKIHGTYTTAAVQTACREILRDGINVWPTAKPLFDRENGKLQRYTLVRT